MYAPDNPKVPPANLNREVQPRGGGKAKADATDDEKTTAEMMDEAGEEDDEMDADYDDAGMSSSRARRKKKRMRSLPIDPKTFNGKWPDDLLHCPLTLESAATAVGTRTRSSDNDDDSLAWVACDGACARWFHAVCVQIAPSADDEWLCEECVAAQPDEDMDVLVE